MRDPFGSSLTLLIGLLRAFWRAIRIVMRGFRAASAPTGRRHRSILAGRDGRVIDGDTLDVVTAAGVVRVRLTGIDAPELGQGATGRMAKAGLERLVAGRVLSLVVEGRDIYGRTTGRVLVHHRTAAGTVEMLDVCRAMVLSGLAVATADSPYIDDERTARRRKAGLWGRRGGIPDPKAWRQANGKGLAARSRVHDPIA